MSITVVRTCDTCGVTMNDQASWMIIAFPLYRPTAEGMPEEAPEYDFCTFGCLHKWVNEEDEEPEAKTKQTLITAPPHVEVPDGTPPPPTEAPRVHAPQMTLAQALASGQLDFSRGPE